MIQLTGANEEKGRDGEVDKRVFDGITISQSGFEGKLPKVVPLFMLLLILVSDLCTYSIEHTGQTHTVPGYWRNLWFLSIKVVCIKAIRGWPSYKRT